MSPRVAKKQKVNVAPSGDDREEAEGLATKKTRRGTSYGGSPVSPRQSKKQKVNSEKSLGDDGDDREEFLQIEKGLHLGESQAQTSQDQTFQAQSSQAHSSQASQAQSSQTEASRWEVPQSSQASQTGAWGRWFS
ncbi:hypothetical protein Rs2_29040 [Raphanus sativus]|nr:hypothetical protein Rs2_29040 [Raphanus sativus]